MIQNDPRRPFRFAVLVFPLVFTGCGGAERVPTATVPPVSSTAVASVTVSLSATSLAVGSTATATASLKTASGATATEKPVEWSSSPSNVATVNSAGLVTAVGTGTATITATSEGKSGTATIAVTPAPVATVALSAAVTTVPVRTILPVVATLKDGSGANLTARSVTWRTSDTTVARVDAAGSVIALTAGTVQIIASSEGKEGVLDITVLRGALPIRGLYTQFDQTGFPNGYYSGDAIKYFDKIDPNLPSIGLVRNEIANQMDAIRALGVNTLTFELRSADAVLTARTFPDCNVSPSTGLLFPQIPTAHLDNLVAFFDLAQSKGLKIMLRLVNNRMDEQYKAESMIWLGSILNRLKIHPALELVLFEGDERTLDTNGDGQKDVCGGLAEPPLNRGPDRQVAQYVQWAIGYAQSLGLPAKKLSAQAVLGAFVVDMELGAGSAFQDRRQWHSLSVMKTIFDRLNIPEDQRTYAISFYETNRCSNAAGYACTDIPPAAWAEETMARAWSKIGVRTRARMVAVEYGVETPHPSGWTSDLALENAVAVMRRYGVEGGSFWRWTNFDATEEANPAENTPIKRRGSYTYTSAKDALVRAYGTP